MTGAMIVLVTCSPAEADKLAVTLVEEKLAACVNAVPSVLSTYTWQGKMCKDSETLLIIKSEIDFWERLQSRIKALHSYETPEMLCFSVDRGYEPYLQWLNSQLEGSFH